MAALTAFRGTRVPSTLLVAALFFLPGAARAVEDEPVDLPCKIMFLGPSLDFELRFFTGFEVSVPTRALEGPRRPFALRVLITPLDEPDARPALFERTFSAGPFPPGSNELRVRDSIATGTGRYKLSMALIDSARRRCFLERDINAELRKKDRGVTLSVKPGEILNSRVRMFRSERAVVEQNGKPPLRVKVFLNLDVPRTRARTRVRSWEITPRLAALRAISRNPRIGKFALVAYSVEDQSVITRHGLQDRFDFPSLGRHIDELEPGLVSIDQLEKDSGLSFFNEMLIDELPGPEPVDAYIFVGPDVLVRKNREKEVLESIGPLAAPVFFLADGRMLWKGLIGKTVNFFHGKTLRFFTPVDMTGSVEEIVQSIDGAE